MRAVLVVAAISLGCGVPFARYPSDVQAAFARDEMRRLETERLIVYYPEARRDVAHRIAAGVDRCAAALRGQARIDNRHAREKMVVVVPDAPFNNAYVLPPMLGLRDVSVIPAANTADFTTELGLPPDPAIIGCHEIVHYVQVKQMAGLWGLARTVLGDLVTPQIGLDGWFLEGLATYYEARLQGGATGRPRWPVFTGMFHAAYAGGAIGGGDLSEYGRLATVGHQYLVGAMFIEYLVERSGEEALWKLIDAQARSWSIFFALSGRFDDVYGKGLGALVDEFRGWVKLRFPVRPRPPGERVVRRLGTDARWAWGPSGQLAAVDSDVDVPARLTVWDAAGRVVDRRTLVDVLPPRRLVIGGPQLVSGMSFARDGTLWLTAVDLGATYQTTRLLRWRRGDLDEIARGLGPGGAVMPDGRAYVHMVVDGDRWSLAARDLASGHERWLWRAAPGQYALRVSPSPDGASLAVSAWDGARFVVWILDAATGERRGELAGGPGRPVYDAAFTDDGRLVLLDEVDGRFQVAVAAADGTRRAVTDTPYGALEPRVSGGRLRFLAREGWRWVLDEVDLPVSVSDPAPVPVPVPVPGSAPAPPPRILSDEPYSRLDDLFRPSLHSFALLAPSAGVTQVGLALAGGDRLDLIRWSLAAYLDPRDLELSGAAGLLWNDLAPWVVAATGSRTAYVERIYFDDGELAEQHDHELRDAALSLGRVWRGSYGLAIGGAYAYERVDDLALDLLGPEARLVYAGLDGAPYTGVDRGLVLTAAGAWFPRRAGPIGDLRGELDLFLPLPLGRRHVIAASGRAHALVGDGVYRPLLQIGGLAAGVPLWQSREADPDIDIGADVLPGQHRFVEQLRGFEDLPLAAERAALGDLGWRYPLVIDRGITNLWFLPASYVSQLDLELFGSGALLRPDDVRYHAAAGGALTLRLSLFRVPLALQYQLSRRLTDDRAWLHLFVLGQ